jgi:hypothetical protein
MDYLIILIKFKVSRFLCRSVNMYSNSTKLLIYVLLQTLYIGPSNKYIFRVSVDDILILLTV